MFRNTDNVGSDFCLLMQHESAVIICAKTCHVRIIYISSNVVEATAFRTADFL
jgi:hypothetical protein